MKVVPISSTPRARKHRETAAKQLLREAVELDPTYVPATSDPDQPLQEGAQDSIDPDLRHRLISEAAYGLYTQRGFADGYDMDDWLQAETQVDHLLLNPQFSERASSG